MGQLSRLLVLGLIMAAFASPACAEVITFDDLDYGSLVPSDYAGVTWGTGTQQLKVSSGNETELTPSDGHFVYLNDPGYVSPGVWNESSTSWTFSTPQKFNGAWFTSSNNDFINIGQTITYKLYDAENQLLYASSPLSLPVGSSFVWYGAGYGDLVSKVEVHSSGGYWAMDDISYAPEPCTLALVGLGLVGVRLRRRRPRSRKDREVGTADA